MKDLPGATTLQQTVAETVRPDFRPSCGTTAFSTQPILYVGYGRSNLPLYMPPERLNPPPHHRVREPRGRLSAWKLVGPIMGVNRMPEKALKPLSFKKI